MEPKKKLHDSLEKEISVHKKGCFRFVAWVLPVSACHKCLILPDLFGSRSCSLVPHSSTS